MLIKPKNPSAGKTTDIPRGNLDDFRDVLLRVLCIGLAIALLVGFFSIKMSPIRAFGGAVWLKSGVHYLSNEQIASKTEQLNAPKETIIAAEIKSSTQSCDDTAQGYCRMDPDVYVYKTLTTAAVAYVPGTPDTKVIIGYCTLCNDNTFSPSCAVGRGACSYHSGVQAYNVPRYRTIPGTAAVEAQPAVYSYEPKSYKDSPQYISPDAPDLKAIVRF